MYIKRKTYCKKCKEKTTFSINMTHYSTTKQEIVKTLTYFYWFSTFNRNTFFKSVFSQFNDLFKNAP